MKIRSPPLPDDLNVQWDYFLDNIPDWLWTKHTSFHSGGALCRNEIGQRLIDDMHRIAGELGTYFIQNPYDPPVPEASPHEPKPKKFKENEPDPAAFHKWMRTMMKKRRAAKLAL